MMFLSNIIKLQCAGGGLRTSFLYGWLLMIGGLTNFGVEPIAPGNLSCGIRMQNVTTLIDLVL